MKKVFVNGTFDLLHVGHLELLNYAKSCGDYLLVALDSDDRVKSAKGLNRPINSLDSRLAIMRNLKAVNRAVSFSSDEELKNIVKNYKPEIMIVGSDWQGKTVIGSEFASSLQFFDRISDYSSTDIIRKISEK